MKKRVTAAVMAFVMLLTLTGCQSKEAKAVDETIAAIGTVTLESEEAIRAARNAYESLSAEDREDLKNADALTEAEETLRILQVIDAIDRLPHINLKHKNKLDEVMGMYEAIPTERRSEVTNYGKLQKAFSSWYALAYSEAETLYEENDLDGAMEYYQQLPKGYEEADARMAEIQPKLQLAKARRALFGTWTWDEEFAKASDGTSYPADFQTITFSEDDRPYSSYSIYGNAFGAKVETVTVSDDLLSQSAITEYYPGCIEQCKSTTASNIDYSTSSLFDDDGNVRSADDMETVPVPDGEYAVLVGGPYMSLTGSYQLRHSCKIEYHFQKDGRLRVEYFLRDVTKGTDRKANMTFYYTAE